MNVVIIGNSAAGMSALEQFRKHDPISQLTIISSEGTRPYSRVLLPYYLRGKVSHEHLFVREQSYYKQFNAACIKGTVVRLLVKDKSVQLEDKTTISYDKLLIATGSSPTMPPIPGLAGDGVHHLWTLADVDKLEPYFTAGNRVVVLGSGFVSLQGACAALSCGLKVSVVELMNRIMPRALDDRGANLLASRMSEKNVDVRVNTITTHVERSKDKTYTLFFKDGTALTTDFIIVGTGVHPNIDFLQDTGIKIKSGIVVNERMETSLPGIYAAGDVAQVPSFSGGNPVVHALWPTAVETGGVAGRCMAENCTPYTGSLNMNVTQMFDITVASMGDFLADEGCERWSDKSLPDDQHMTIVLKGGVPIGATCVGSSELVSTLGLLRPLIRRQVRIEGKPDTLKALMAQNISQHHQAFVK